MTSGKDLKAFLETVGFKGLFALPVVVGIVGIEPVALGIDIQVRDLGEFGRLDQELLLRNRDRRSARLRFR